MCDIFHPQILSVCWSCSLLLFQYMSFMDDSIIKDVCFILLHLNMYAIRTKFFSSFRYFFIFFLQYCRHLKKVDDATQFMCTVSTDNTFLSRPTNAPSKKDIISHTLKSEVMETAKMNRDVGNCHIFIQPVKYRNFQVFNIISSVLRFHFVFASKSAQGFSQDLLITKHTDTFL